MPTPVGLAFKIANRRAGAIAMAALAALVASGAATPTLRAQPDLAAIRARAEAGDAEALNALGNAYASGEGVPQSYPNALRLYQQAADRGLAAAQFNLGMMHELGRGTGRDPAAAFKHYLQAARQGFAPAQFNVGNMYANGTGVPQDYFEATLWFRQAADRGVPEAQYNLALAYELGRGVTKDEKVAQRWYRDAAAKGYARAQYNLALMLEEGRGSLADRQGAIELYRAAARQNFVAAQNNLGILLADGRGAPGRLIEAYAWLAVAVENGAKPVGRDLVARRLSPEQLAEAHALAADLSRQIGRPEPFPPAPTAVSTADNGASQSVSGAPATGGSPGPEEVALNRRIIKAESELQQAREENVRLNERVEALSREKAGLEQQLVQAAAQAGEQADWVRKREEANQAPGARVEPLTSARSDPAEADRLAAEQRERSQELTRQLEAANRSLAEHKARNEALENAFQSAKAAAAAAPVPGLAAQLESATAERENARAEIERLARELATRTRELEAAREDRARVADLTAANEKLSAEVVRLEQQLAQAGDVGGAAQSLAATRESRGAQTTAPAQGSAPRRPAYAGATAPSSVQSPAPRFHVVQAGETLTGISERYYGTGERWREIYHANHELLSVAKALRAGQRLRIP